MDRERQTASYHVGSGIVWDSEPAQEYAECLLKAAVLLRRRGPFSLLETMRWSPQEGYFLLGHHMDRLRDSAAYFGFVLDEAALHEALDLNATMLDAPSKVRLLLNQAGEVSLQSSPLPAAPDLQPRRLLLAQSPIATDNIWLYHKTTRRDVYEQARAAQPGGDDVLLWNEAGFLTEATTANIVVQLDGCLLTPPVSAGLLAGTFRRHLLHRGEIAEQPLRCSDLARSEALFLINSVRGWQPAILVEQIK